MSSTSEAIEPDPARGNDLQTMRSAGWPVEGRRRWSYVVVAIVLVATLCFSFQRLGLSAASREGIVAIQSMPGGGDASQVVNAASRFFDQGWPPVISRERETNRIEGFDPNRIPWFSHLETREKPTVSIDIIDGEVVQREVMETEQVLVEPLGYLFRVAWLMLETLEIALWGTLFAVFLGLPLSLLGSRRIVHAPLLVTATRAVCSMCRAVPELISALFFVLLFGFGPAAGVLALGFHSAGFLGKFFADDIDNADDGPANALANSGVGKLGVFLHALLPQVLPQYLAYMQYILERNVRAATVLGIVGAGGIGVELMGKWHNFQYGHATTVLLAIFASVVLLETVTQTFRKKLIRE
ncbi:phosphonate ABC transporter, permease protein PhnE [Blastopirellula marina]|uniref:Phosphonate ABC transporter, permease protein PhnE n=1 Tax=Blastopirellula marina TaxID=124 RepID=A0A2S8GR31_9BACT|nr:phosphonate ABC transporter, permease protein PhnE [Blastopirellula marina]PQO46890.1 phosphonate ABC transporter, permease protein PhnE [Blastopirellula marina]